MSSRYVLAILFALCLKPLSAEHLPGGTISYTCLGGNYYELKLTLLWECSGFPMIPQDLHFYNSCGVVFDISNLQPVLVESSSQICPDEAGAISTCDGGTIPGFERYEFTTSLYMSPCSSWTVYWSICCRQPSINVQSLPGLYIEMRLDNVAEACTNSPIFDHLGVSRVCIGQPVDFDAGATDVDGHRLEYSLIDARQVTSNVPLVVNTVNYVFPNYGGEPIAGMALDEYGQITFTPTVQGYIVVVVQVDEYNENGVWIGGVMRDLPFIVTTCSNTIPSAAAGMITSTSGGASATGERSLLVCPGGEACVTMEFSDPDADQTLSITTTADIIIPGATVEVTGTNPISATICWQATALEVGDYSFVITVMDDDCPIMGTRSFVYTVEVGEAGYAGEDGSAIACELAQPFTFLDSLAGTPPTGGTWTGPDGEWHSGFFNNEEDGPGTYTYTYSEGEGCPGTALLEIEFLAVDDSLCISIGLDELAFPGLELFPNPSTGRITLQTPRTVLTRIELHDLHGKCVYAAPLPQYTGVLQFDLPESLADGIYMLQAWDKNAPTRAHRLVLQR